MADNFHMNTGKDVFPNAAGSGSYSGSDGKTAERGEENGEHFDFHEAMLQVCFVIEDAHAQAYIPIIYIEVEQHQYNEQHTQSGIEARGSPPGLLDVDNPGEWFCRPLFR